MIKIITRFLSFVLIVFLASCVKNMDEAYIPSYIKIDKIDIYTSGAQGSSSSYITDAWIFVDGADMGAYPLPAIIPILSDGNHTIKVSPGIKLNGVASTRVPYPMVEPIEIDLNLVKDSIIEMAVTTKYFATSRFALIEDFEDLNLKFETTIQNTSVWGVSKINIDPDSYIFEGARSGMSKLDEDHNYMQIITKQTYEQLPKQGIPVFIEMDFKCNTTVVLSYIPYPSGSSVDLIYLNPTEEWKKIYINLTSTISYDVNSYGYRFLLSADHNSSLDESVVLIDNFKIVYRLID